MGRQVNFIMLDLDEAEFESHLRRLEILFIPYRLATPNLVAFAQMSNAVADGHGAALFLSRVQDRDQLLTSPVGTLRWTVDLDQSSALEFMRSARIGNILHRGRLYFQTGYYATNGDWVAKPASFSKWAASLLNWIRRRYRKDTTSGLLVGPHAVRWIEDRGGAIEA